MRKKQELREKIKELNRDVDILSKELVNLIKFPETTKATPEKIRGVKVEILTTQANLKLLKWVLKCE